MRITNNMMVSTMMRNMNDNLERMNKTQQQWATGKQFLVPSDDPIGVSKSLRLHTDVAELEQFKRNTDDAISWLDITETALKNTDDVLQRARELTVQASNGTNTPEDRLKIKEEITQLKGQLINISNRTYAGRYVFSGFKTDQELLNENGEYNFNLGQNEIIEYQVGVADTLVVNVLGQKVFGIGDGDQNTVITNEDVDVSGEKKAQMIDVFTKLEQALDRNDDAEINVSIERIDNQLGNLLAVRAEVGAKMNRMEMTKNRLLDENINFTKLLSENEDADMAETVMKLKQEESVYNASLSIGARVIQPTLVDFIR